MARGSVRVFNGAFANVQGSDTVQQLLAALPDAVTAPIQAAIEQGGDDFVAAAKAIAPVAAEFETHPGQLRDSIHREANGRGLSVTVAADARDAKGRLYPAHVEYGHTDERSGHHVAAKPFFWPSYRVARKKIKSRVSRAITKAVKAAKAEGGE